MMNIEDIKNEAQKFRDDLETRMGEGFIVKPFIPNYRYDYGRLRFITEITQEHSWDAADSEYVQEEMDRLTKIVEERLAADYEIISPRPMFVPKDVQKMQFIFIVKVIQRKEYLYEDESQQGYFHPYRERC